MPCFNRISAEVEMPPRAKDSELDSAAELARKMEILEREMAVQRAAMERLKEMAAVSPRRGVDRDSRLQLRRRPA